MTTSPDDPETSDRGPACDAGTPDVGTDLDQAAAADGRNRTAEFIANPRAAVWKLSLPVMAVSVKLDLSPL